MNKTKLKYVKYTKQELDRYVRDKNSCISLINSEIHIGFPPWGFANFQDTITYIIAQGKIGKYDTKLDGIVLEVRNIKVFGISYPVHDDDPINHINIKANFYVFQPRIGAIVKGAVKHISHGHVAVIIYRVFNVSIRFNRIEVRDSLKINQQISFRIKKFDLHGAMPYIEGELIETNKPIGNQTSVRKHLKFEDDQEFTANGGDSGISTEETDTFTVKKVKIEPVSSSDESSSSRSSRSRSRSRSGSRSSSSRSRSRSRSRCSSSSSTNKNSSSGSNSDSDSKSEDNSYRPFEMGLLANVIFFSKILPQF